MMEPNKKEGEENSSDDDHHVTARDKSASSAEAIATAKKLYCNNGIVWEQRGDPILSRTQSVDNEEIDTKLSEVWKRNSARKRNAAKEWERPNEEQIKLLHTQERLREWLTDEYHHNKGIFQPWRDKSIDGSAHEVDIEHNCTLWSSPNNDWTTIEGKLCDNDLPSLDGYDAYSKIKDILAKVIKLLKMDTSLYCHSCRGFLSTKYDVVAVCDRRSHKVILVVRVIDPCHEDACLPFESDSVAVEMYDSMAIVPSHYPFGCLIAPDQSATISTFASEEEQTAVVYTDAINAAHDWLLCLLNNDKEEEPTEKPLDPDAETEDRSREQDDVFYPPMPMLRDDGEVLAAEQDISNGQSIRRKIAYSPIYCGQPAMMQAFVVALACALKTSFVDTRIPRPGELLHFPLRIPMLSKKGWSFAETKRPFSLCYNTKCHDSDDVQVVCVIRCREGLSAVQYLACDLQGRAFSLKIYLFALDPVHAATLEVARWIEIYPEFRHLCRQIKLLDGKVCTILPFVAHVPKKDQEEESSMKEAIQREKQRIKQLGYSFPGDILDGRSVGCVVDKATGAKKIVLTNLKSLLKAQGIPSVEPGPKANNSSE